MAYWCGVSLHTILVVAAAGLFLYAAAYSGEGDQHSGVMSITIPADSDQAIGAKRRWQDDCVGSDRNRQEELIRSGDLGGGGKGRHLSPFSPRISV
jgi:hypothetical protein